MKHTPTPWEVNDDDSGIIGTWGPDEDDWGLICATDYAISSSVPEEQRPANAAFIVKACNAHDELVEALKTAIQVMKDNEIDTMLSSEFDVLFEDVIAEVEA